jgi:hypothetical protein
MGIVKGQVRMHSLAVPLSASFPLQGAMMKPCRITTSTAAAAAVLLAADVPQAMGTRQP